jgi:hypothetical protein
MAKQTINIGTAVNDGTGDPCRTAFDKVNDNFDELYLTVVESPLKLISLTTAERDALASPVNGSLIYNETTSKIQAYAGGSWVDLH